LQETGQRRCLLRFVEPRPRSGYRLSARCRPALRRHGSQALVASIAIEHDIPFVCVTAATRNHFALDLGLDRDDPRGSMDAFHDAVERRIDYATVGDRLFVNNVSLGVYATIVQQDSYRDAKRETSLTLLPEMLGSTAEPFDLQLVTPDGIEVDGAFLIMVSNNPYVLGPSVDVSQRRSLQTGALGVFAVTAASGTEAARLMARSAVGLRRRDPGWHEFTCEAFEVRSRAGSTFAGVDGEALDMLTPLGFRIHPRGMRVLVPESNLEIAARRRARYVSVGALPRCGARDDAGQRDGRSLTTPSVALVGASLRIPGRGQAKAHRNGCSIGRPAHGGQALTCRPVSTDLQSPRRRRGTRQSARTVRLASRRAQDLR
jgi:diacylglycerol kinase family enzyme